MVIVAVAVLAFVVACVPGRYEAHAFSGDGVAVRAARAAQNRTISAGSVNRETAYWGASPAPW